MISKNAFTILLRTQASKQACRTATPTCTFVNQNSRGTIPSAPRTISNEKDDTMNPERSMLLSALCAPGSEVLSIDECVTEKQNSHEATLKYRTKRVNPAPPTKTVPGSFHVTYVEPNTHNNI